MAKRASSSKFNIVAIREILFCNFKSEKKMTSTQKAHPEIIQGGMGIGVSNWKLAKAVSQEGQLGVVSGTCIDSVLIRRLQDGDFDGDVRRALSHFPCQELVNKVLGMFYRPEGRDDKTPYKLLPLHRVSGNTFRDQLSALGSFVEVFLAKESHDGVVGLNLLTKIQVPNLATIYGAMLAKVDYVLMGAGIPREIPGVIDKFLNHDVASIKLDVVGKTKELFNLSFNPADLIKDIKTDIQIKLQRPKFLPIVTTHTLAQVLFKKAGQVDGFVVEAPEAGGHNAPPRTDNGLNDKGEPIYNDKDRADLAKMKEIGVPFWLAGGIKTREDFLHAKAQGAAGVQLGTVFSMADESGLTAKLKNLVRKHIDLEKLEVFTDRLASPTGFPFKVAKLDDTLSDPEVYNKRERICDLGYLREAAVKDDGKLAFRCSSEPVDQYVKKGGNVEDTAHRVCLCNALMSAVGMGQVRDEDQVEPSLLTSGDQLVKLKDFMTKIGKVHFSASDVIQYFLGKEQNKA